MAGIIISGTAISNPRKADGTTLLLPDNYLALVVLDKSGDGFAANTNFGLTIGDDISTFVGNADDVIIGSNATSEVIANTLVTVPGTVNLAGLGGGIDEGDQFGIFFFDGLAAGSTTVAAGTVSYGFKTDASWTLKADGTNTEFGSGAGKYPQFQNVAANLQITAVPEPSSAWILGLGWLLFGLRRKRRTRRLV